MTRSPQRRDNGNNHKQNSKPDHRTTLWLLPIPRQCKNLRMSTFKLPRTFLPESDLCWIPGFPKVVLYCYIHLYICIMEIYMIQHIVLDRYKKTSDASCGNGLGGRYRTLNEAASSCNSDRICGGVFDYDGDGQNYATCRSPILKHISVGSILYRKCKLINISIEKVN